MENIISIVLACVVSCSIAITYSMKVDRPIEDAEKFIEKAYEICDYFNEKPLEYERSGKVYCSGGVSFDITLKENNYASSSRNLSY